MDASVLFFKALPDTGLAKKPKKCKSDKKSKERLTVAFFVSWSGFKVCKPVDIVVKFHDAFENCLILLNRMIYSIFTAEKHG